MSFIRIKKIKGNEYAYLVQNKWRRCIGRKGKSAKQKVKEYLGRVYRLGIEYKDKGFWETVDSEPETYLRLATKDKIIHDLIRFELIRHGFANIKDKWKKDELEVDILKRKIVNKINTRSVIAMNEGYMCSYNLKRIFRYEQRGDITETGYELARLFVESGIDIPQEVFVGFYDKL